MADNSKPAPKGEDPPAYGPPPGPPGGLPPQQPPQAHYSADPNQGYPPQGYPPQGGYYQQSPPMGYYQQGPYGPPPPGQYPQQPYGQYHDNRGRSKPGCLEGCLAALACCCCLDLLF